jgi:type VI secretion system secreted protein VgrG
MANRSFNQFFRTLHNYPVLLDCNFIVDSQNINGLGIRSLKGPGIKAVYMNSSAAPAGSPNLGLARTYGLFGASAITNTGNTVVTGNLGLTPGSSITGFPPGTFSGVENIDNSAAVSAKAQAQAAYTDMQSRSSTPISSTLDGQTLTPGVYSESSGTFNLAQSGNGTLTLNGNGVYIFKCSSTLTTGAGGVPTINLTGGAQASNVYWAVGSSATINSGFSGVFQGNVVANTSITDTLGGTVNGSLIALNGAVTLSAASIVNVQPLAGTPAQGNPNPNPGTIMVVLQDNYNRYYGGFSQFTSPLSGSQLTSVVAGNPYVIFSLGTATLAQWQAVGLPVGITPAVGAAFVATSSGSIGGSASVELSAASGVDHIEVVGDPNQTLYPQPSNTQGGQIILNCILAGAVSAPTDGTLISLSLYLSNSALLLSGE